MKLVKLAQSKKKLFELSSFLNDQSFLSEDNMMIEPKHLTE